MQARCDQCGDPCILNGMMMVLFLFFFGVDGFQPRCDEKR